MFWPNGHAKGTFTRLIQCIQDDKNSNEPPTRQNSAENHMNKIRIVQFLKEHMQTKRLKPNSQKIKENAHKRIIITITQHS